MERIEKNSRDLAEPVLQKCKEQINGSVLISKLEGPGKISPDGSKILVSPAQKALKIYSVATGIKIATLEDDKNSSFDNRRVGFHWSTTGRYIYAAYCTPEKSDTGSALYINKVWDSNTCKKLYQILTTPCCKLYFAPTDKYLLKKATSRTLEAYQADTGVNAGFLGEPSYGYIKTPQDPLGQWIISYDQKRTSFYEASKLASLKDLKEKITCWSHDGNLICTEENRTSHIYNRLLEEIIKIPLNKWTLNMAISPCNKALICYENESEDHYSLETGKTIKTFRHDSFDLRTNDLMFADFTGNTTITLSRKDQKTEISLAHGAVTQKLECPQKVDRIVYTKNNTIIGLAYFDTILYFLNLKTGALIPCNIYRKHTLFNYKQAKHLSQDGYFVTRNGDHYELRQLAADNPQATPLVAVLTQKLEKAAK